MLKGTSLTPREIQVLRLICKEKINTEIAGSLKVSVSTAEFHRKNIYKKTNAKSVIGLFKYALKNEIIKFKF